MIFVLHQQQIGLISDLKTKTINDSMIVEQNISAIPHIKPPFAENLKRSHTHKINHPTHLIDTKKILVDVNKTINYEICHHSTSVKQLFHSKR